MWSLCHFWWFFGWDLGNPTILRKYPISKANQVLVNFVKNLGLEKAPPFLGQIPNSCRRFVLQASLTVIYLSLWWSCCNLLINRTTWDCEIVRPQKGCLDPHTKPSCFVVNFLKCLWSTSRNKYLPPIIWTKCTWNRMASPVLYFINMIVKHSVYITNTLQPLQHHSAAVIAISSSSSKSGSFSSSSSSRVMMAFSGRESLHSIWSSSSSLSG